MKKVLCMIPARLGSTRLKNKMLQEVNGKPVIVHTIERALATKHIGRIVVCTDSEEVWNEVNSHLLFEVGVVTTFNTFACDTGCDRTSLTLCRYPQLKQGMSDDCILHLHGDEANINPKSLDRLIEHHVESFPHACMTQLMSRTHGRDNTRHSCKVDVSWEGNAINGYSRDESHFYTALGAFAFDPIALLAFHRLPVGQKEHQSKIEQYRFIENGVTIRGFDAGFGDVKSSIDTQSDLDRMKSLLQEY